jgi:tetratricopeptide (TPR) repeat protein
LKYAPKEGRSSLWAAVSLDVAGAQWALGIRVSGEESQALLANATATYKSLLRVYTREQLPQDWATTQNNLGLALSNQGIRTGGEAGAKLLAEAVAAYRAALEVYTREQLPQDWATTQNNLGGTLQEQGIRTGGEAGAKLLAEAVAAYRAALEVRTKAHLPDDWRQTTRNLATAYVAYDDWENAFALYKELYEFDPTDPDAYTQAALLSHEILFEYIEAYALNKQWLSAHPDDISAQSDFAERHFTTGRFDEAARRLADLVSKPNVPTEVKVALQAIGVANAVARGQLTTVREQVQALRALVAEQSEDFRVEWSFSGTKHFIETEERLAPKRAWLLNLIAAFEQQNRAAILKGLDALQPADGDHALNPGADRSGGFRPIPDVR